MNKIILSIDPGANGGYSVLYPNGGVEIDKLPDTEGDFVDLIDGFVTLTESKDHRICYLENLVKYTGSPMPSSAMATYAGNWGFLKGVLAANRFRVILVTPQKWQKALGLGTSKGKSKTQWKNHLKGEAQRLFPNAKITLASADAALIHRYAELEERV